MKFDISAKVYGMVFGKMLKSYYEKNFPDIDIKSVIKEVNKEYKAIIERTPDIGGKENILRSNLVGASYFFAMGKKVPNMTPELMDKIVIEVMGSGPMYDMHAKARKKGLLFSDKEMANWEKAAKRSETTPYDYDWKFTFKRGKDEFYYDYTECGVCKLAKQENVMEYLPCMCKMDYPKFKMKGGQLYREHTIANGDGHCDFHVVRIKDEQ